MQDETDPAEEEEADEQSQEEASETEDAEAEEAADGADEIANADVVDDAADAEEEETGSTGIVSVVASKIKSLVSSKENETEDTEVTGEVTVSEAAETLEDDEVYDEHWWLDYYFATDGTNCVLNGEKIEIVFTLCHDWWDANDEYYYEEPGDYEYSVEVESAKYISLQEESQEDDGLHLTFKALQAADRDVYFTISITADGETVEEEINLWIPGEGDGYYYLSLDKDDVDNVMLGKDFDLSAYEKYVTLHHKTSENGETVYEEVGKDKYFLRLCNYDGSAWKSTSDSSLTDRQTADGTGVNIIAILYNDETGTDQTAYKDYEGVHNIWVDFEDLYDEYADAVSFSYDGYDYEYDDEDWHYIIDDADDLTVSVKNTGITLPDGYEVRWTDENGKYDANFWEEAWDYGYINMTDNKDGSVTISVNAKAMAEAGTYDSYFGMGADIYYGGNWICYAEDWIDVVVSFERYSNEAVGDQTIVKGDWSWIGSTMWCEYRNADDLYGDGCEVDITNVEIIDQNPEDEDDTNVIELNKWENVDDGNTYTEYGLYASAFGTATVKVTYQTRDGGTAFTTFIVTVADSVAYLDAWTTDGENTENLLVGLTRTWQPELYVSLLGVYEESEEYEYIYTETYTVDDLADEDCDYSIDVKYDEEYVSATVVDGYIEVTGVAEGGTEVTVVAYDSEGNEIASYSIWVEVTEGEYWTITGVSDQVPVGGSIDLGSDIYYVITHYYVDEDGEAQTEVIPADDENYQIRLDVNNVDWTAWDYADGSSEDDLLPTLVRTSNDYTDFHIVLDRYNEDGDLEDDINAYWPSFDYIDYSISFDASYDGGTSDHYLFAGKEVSFEVYATSYSEYDLPDGCTVEWEVELYDEDWNQIDSWTSTDEVLTLTPTETDMYCQICAVVYYTDGDDGGGDESQNNISEYWREFEVVEDGYVEVNAGVTAVNNIILPGETTDITGTLIMYSSEYPGGVSIDGEITNVQIAEAHGWDENDEWVEVDGDKIVEIDGTTVKGLSVGDVDLLVTLTDEDGNEYTGYTYLEVSSDFYYLILEDEYEICWDSDGMTLDLVLYHAYLDDDDNPIREEVSYDDMPYTLELYYDDYIVSVEQTGETTLTITGCTGGETYLYVDVFDEAGNWIGSGYTTIHVNADHTYGEGVTVKPTCTEQGYTEYTCTICGYTWQDPDSYEAATGHSWDDGVVTKAATATATGIRTFTCTVCGETYEEVIPATGTSVDTTALAAAIKQANSLAEANYTSASWANLQAALAAANEAMTSGDQDAIDEATKNLQAAIAALVKVVDDEDSAAAATTSSTADTDSKDTSDVNTSGYVLLLLAALVAVALLGTRRRKI
ncbi:MAG: hypothetical protein LUC83_04530 [Clostridiales bacterium]|nr:hypothetical protein [Clostridiales bacterium]